MGTTVEKKAENPGQCPFLIMAHRDLCGIDLSARYLPGSDMSFLLLSRSKLYNSDLKESLFICANLSHADLSGSSLKKCDFRRTNLSNTNLEEAILEGAIFDSKTILPFAKEKAIEHGMIMVG